jgi:hypothetical protein
MKRALFLLLSVSVIEGFGQTLTSEEIITNALRTGMIEGGLTKHVRAEGDEAAVQLTKVLAERNVKDTEIDISLIVLSDAFSDLKLVEAVSDRHPRTALLLLKYFDCITRDPALRGRVADARRSIVDAVAKLDPR